MKALVQEGDGSADVLHVREISRPALAAGRVLVKVRAASVNALDWHSAHGGVGTSSVRIAKALGAHVTAVTGANKVDIVRSLGADEVIDYTKEDFTRRAERFDVVFDVAATRSIGSLRRVLLPGGVLVLVGADKRGGVAIFGRILSALVRSRVLRQRVKFF